MYMATTLIRITIAPTKLFFFFLLPRRLNEFSYSIASAATSINEKKRRREEREKNEPTAVCIHIYFYIYKSPHPPRKKKKKTNVSCELTAPQTGQLFQLLFSPSLVIQNSAKKSHRHAKHNKTIKKKRKAARQKRQIYQ